VHAGDLTHIRPVVWVPHLNIHRQPGEIAASPWVMNSTAIAAMISPMIWVKIRIPVRPISDASTTASLNATKVLAATATMAAQMSR
jgi:hypothetical protein